MATEMQSLVTVTVDGIGSLGKFDSKSGGEQTVTVTKHRPGGMGNEVSYPSLPTYSDITVSRVYRNADIELVAALLQQAGRPKMTVVEQPLDAEGNAYGSPRTFRGRLGSIKPGNVNSESNAVRMWELDMSVETASN